MGIKAPYPPPPPPTPLKGPYDKKSWKARRSPTLRRDTSSRNLPSQSLRLRMGSVTKIVTVMKNNNNNNSNNNRNSNSDSNSIAKW